MILVRSSLLTRGMAMAMLLVAAACENNNEPSTPSSLQGVAGSTVTGRAGQPVTVAVKVLASNGRPLGGQTVTFAPTTGTVAPATATTDELGQAQTVWTLGNAVGTQTLNATVGTLTPLTISATVTAGNPATIAVQAGNNQSAPIGTTVAVRPSVIVRDAGSNPVPGATVNFEVVGGNGAVTGGSATTDQSGVAAVGSWQLGTQAGTQTLRATVAGQTSLSATFTANATPGTASRLEVRGGNAVTGAAGTALAAGSLPSVAVVDASGNPIPNAQVTFNVVSGGGSITGATQTTNAQGVATVGGFTLGQGAGPNIVTAVSSGVQPVTFLVTGTAGAASQIQLVSGNNQAVRAGQSLQAPASVRVVDRFGNPVAGTTVQFVVTGGGGTVLGGTQTTNAQGIASVGGWTLGTVPGTNTLVARVAGLADIPFTAIGLAGAPAQIEKISGDAQTTSSFRPTAQPFVVRVLDAEGFPVRGATVTFAPSAAGTGTLSATTVETDENGRASSTFTASGVLGTTTVAATVGTLAPVLFTVTTNANAAARVEALAPLNQSATAGGPVADPPAVRVLDAFGNPVAGVAVTFRPATTNGGSTSGSVQVSNTTTGADGIARSERWTLDGTPGVNTLAAITSVPSNVPNATILFTATGISIPANATITQIAGSPPATAAAGSTVPVAVQVKDAAGIPIAGATVTFQVTIGGGSIAGQPAGTVVISRNTDANGIATASWTLGTAAATTNSMSVGVVGGPVIALTVNTP
jgi:adhesin/invasin